MKDDNDPRQDPPEGVGEYEMLTAFLDYHRDTLLYKLQDLSEEQLASKPTSSSLTLLGLVKHVAYVELWWFEAVFTEREVEFPDDSENPDIEMVIQPNETSQDVIKLYKEQIARSQQITADAANLEERAKLPKHEHRNLRWILLHMLEENARHNGHADFLREAIDGRKGE